jgi:hypothetical protein
MTLCVIGEKCVENNKNSLEKERFLIIDLTPHKKAENFIDLIHHFPSSTEFFRWFAGDTLVVDTLFERKNLNKYERLGNFYIDTLRVYSGRGEFYLDKTLKSLSEELNKEKYQYCSLVSEILKYEKTKISSVLTWPQYTAISHFYHRGEICGICWEIYEIENLLNIADHRKQAGS